MSSLTENTRCIAHLDMDAFFASVELLKYPELRGSAVAIGGGARHQPAVLSDGRRQFARLRDYVGRGVITTSTYEARAFGVFSAMGIMKAAKLAPDIILLPSDFDSYREYSRIFKATVAVIAPVIENVGIDEIYIDLTDFGSQAVRIAKEIKEAVSSATGLSCSIGVAPNKLLAKLCSDLEKPDGLTIVTAADIPHRIWPLKVGKINGIGPKADEKLRTLGIATIGELATVDVGVLRAAFGSTYAAWLCNAAKGIDERPLVTHFDPKSLSREVTFERDLHVLTDRSSLSANLEDLCTRVASDLSRKSLLGKTVGIKIRFENFATVTRDFTLSRATADATTILAAARECLRRVPIDLKIRLLGVRISALSLPQDGAKGDPQGELFPSRI
jgi:DNA polymerase-4